MDVLIPIAIIIAAYLLGAIPFGLLIAQTFGVRDVRKHGSGNIGATNVWRVAGARAAIWVYLLDIGKGVVAVLLASSVNQTIIPRDTFLVLAALAAVIGHVFPVYLKFKGGKGVNTALGVLLALLPLEALAGLIVFIVMVAISRFISLGSITAAVSLAAIVLIERVAFGRPVEIIYVLLTMVIAVLVVITHRKNIKRMIEGTEPRFSLASGSSGKRADHHA